MNGESPLVDTSVLIDYFAGIQSRETNILDQLLERGPAPTTAAIIVQEYLQGLTEPNEFALAEADLEYFDRLPPPDYSLHRIAAENHVKMRRKGITVPTFDTLIVTMAQHAGCPLLTQDRRQKDLARFLKVKLR
ncbi:MAG TPA: PIN domain-containing protein [Candidatus Acidoferrales bacterium]|nr:PIN domain-containing protein [Candidatus Acidoferrales bacterium]